MNSVNRRGFLAALAAPLIARPSLEDIERLTWRRRLFPAYPRNVLLDPGWLTREALLILERNLAIARQVNLDFERWMREDIAFLRGETWNIRKPQRFAYAIQPVPP